ncbi:MAG: hypothetical protein EBV23_14510 [Flavobacteriia bacterium]|nr:hypothetical protein [Flavobacteriia bacterium]
MFSCSTPAFFLVNTHLIRKLKSSLYHFIFLFLREFSEIWNSKNFIHETSHILFFGIIHRGYFFGTKQISTAMRFSCLTHST